MSYSYLALVLFFFLLTLVNYGIYYILVTAGQISWIPFLQLEILFGFGPSIYLYTKSLTDATFKFRKRDWLHFALPALEFVYYRTTLFRDGAIGLSETSVNGLNLLYKTVQWGGLLSVVCYLLLSAYLLAAYRRWLKSHYSNLENRELSWLRKPIVIYALFCVVWIPIRIVDIVAFEESLRPYYFNLGFLGLAATTCWIGFKGYLTASTKTEGFLQSPTTKSPEPESAKLAETANRLQEAMEENQYYLDSDLTLAAFSNATGYGQKEISKALNSTLQLNFHEFVNGYRIETFKRNLELSEFSHLSLLGVALESGFGSKSTFNLVFKANTGLTPKKYKDQLEKKS